MGRVFAFSVSFSAIYTAILLLQLSLKSGCGGGGSAAAAAAARRRMGINYGRLGDDLPAPAEAVALIKSLGFGEVKIFDSDPEVLSALAGSNLRVVMAATNEELQSLASSESASDAWVARRVRPFLPGTRIRAVTVGNEVLSHPENRDSWRYVVPAMQNVQRSLQRLEPNASSSSIKVSTCVAMDALGASYPPSAGAFREDIGDSILRPMLELLASTGSYLFVNAYPYFAWSANSGEIPLEYALFGGPGVADGGFWYENLLDAQLDSFAVAMGRLGFPGVRIAVSETGWPTVGGPGASAANAAAYNGRLAQRMLARPTRGTPRRPGVFVPTFIFSLFNEDQKPGPETERHWGVLYPNSSRVYSVDLLGRT